MRWSSELEMRTCGGLPLKLEACCSLELASTATKQQNQSITSTLTHHQLRPGANRHQYTTAAPANERTGGVLHGGSAFSRRALVMLVDWIQPHRFVAGILDWMFLLCRSRSKKTRRLDWWNNCIDGLGNWISFCFPFLFLMLMGVSAQRWKAARERRRGGGENKKKTT